MYLQTAASVKATSEVLKVNLGCLLAFCYDLWLLRRFVHCSALQIAYRLACGFSLSLDNHDGETKRLLSSWEVSPVLAVQRSSLWISHSEHDPQAPNVVPNSSALRHIPPTLDCLSSIPESAHSLQVPFIRADHTTLWASHPGLWKAKGAILSIPSFSY